jgi:hypothetical protein
MINAKDAPPFNRATGGVANGTYHLVCPARKSTGAQGCVDEILPTARIIGNRPCNFVAIAAFG